MVFITAGNGRRHRDGRGTIDRQSAERARCVLTVGVATKPFGFEGVVRMSQAEEGLQQFASAVDTLIVIPNEKPVPSGQRAHVLRGCAEDG